MAPGRGGGGNECRTAVRRAAGLSGRDAARRSGDAAAVPGGVVLGAVPRGGERGCGLDRHPRSGERQRRPVLWSGQRPAGRLADVAGGAVAGPAGSPGDDADRLCGGADHRGGAVFRDARGRPGRRGAGTARRSEEHTSELQSLMRISSAVFCLKKKNRNNKNKKQKKKTKVKVIPNK